jgi:hypothetical protein
MNSILSTMARHKRIGLGHSKNWQTLYAIQQRVMDTMLGQKVPRNNQHTI